MLCFVFSALVVLLDQFFKRWIILTLSVRENTQLIPGVLDLTHVQNTGAAFSILPDQRWILVGISFIACILLITILLRYNEGFWGTLGLAALLGGAAGNLIDRLFYGYVVDMFEPIFIRFAIFNIADIFITLGGLTFCIFFIATMFRPGKGIVKSSEHDESAEEEEPDESPGPVYNYEASRDDDYDRLSETRVIPSRKRRSQRPAPAEQQDYQGYQDYDSGSEQQDFHESGGSGGSREAGESGGSGESAEFDFFSDFEDDPQERVLPSDDLQEHYECGDDTRDYYIPEPQVFTKPDPAPPVKPSSTLDALDALESELSEDDLLGDYDVDALLREYGFEDDSNQ